MKDLKKVKDLSGKKFNMLTVISLDEERVGRKTYWITVCDCGNVKSVRSDSLQDGTVKSCGCIKKEQDKINLGRETHGKSAERIYKTWRCMKARCYNPNTPRFENYGGRGIKICDEWKNDFEIFYNWALLNGYDDSLTIERIDNDGDYTPDNCKFATIKEQCNNRRSNIVIQIDENKYTLSQISETLNINYSALNARYQRGDRGLDLIRPLR